MLVRHTYVPRWRVPTGGVRAGEGAEAAAVRELREEIGLHAWSVTEVLEPSHDFALDPHLLVDVFVVRDARYSPRWSLGIEDIAEFDSDEPLPSITAIVRDTVIRAPTGG